VSTVTLSSRRLLTILSESMTVCRRCAIVMIVTSRFSSVRRDAWMIASVS
jgi:hypothetical protein